MIDMGATGNAKFQVDILKKEKVLILWILITLVVKKSLKKENLTRKFKSDSLASSVIPYEQVQSYL